LGFQFQYQQFIWLFGGIVLLLLLFIGLQRWKKRKIKAMGEPRLVRSLLHNFSKTRYLVKFILVILAFAVGVVAVMNLRKPGGPDGVNRKGIDIIFALDVSKSMLASDLAPSRLERAKQLIYRLMKEMPNDRIGLILFAGKAYLQMPLTHDHASAQMFVASANPNAVAAQGTVIGDALKLSYEAFESSETRYKAVILLSDGEDHDPNALMQATDLATHGLMVNTVGIGSPQGAHITDAATNDIKKDEMGNPVITKLNEKELADIARITNGIYVQLQSSDQAAKQIQAQLAQIEQKVTGDISLMSFQTYFWWFAGAMLLLLIGDLFIPETKRRA
jgi:Ca-activated chloride channel family protein